MINFSKRFSVGKGNSITVNFTTNNNKNIIKNSNKKNLKVNIDELFEISPDEYDYFDCIKNEKRGFCTYFCQKFKNNQLFIVTFSKGDDFKSRPFKIILLLENIEFILFVNALTYSEDTVSDIFNLKNIQGFS